MTDEPKPAAESELKQDPEPAKIGEALIKATPDWLDDVETIHHAFRYACASIAHKNRRIAALESACRRTIKHIEDGWNGEAGVVSGDPGQGAALDTEVGKAHELLKKVLGDD